MHRHAKRRAMQEESRLRLIAEVAAADAERESKLRNKRVNNKAAELARALPKAGTSVIRDLDALHHEMMARRLKQASASGHDEEEALRLAAEYIRHMMSDPAIASCSILNLSTRVSYVGVDAAYLTMWVSCSNPSVRSASTRVTLSAGPASTQRGAASSATRRTRRTTQRCGFCAPPPSPFDYYLQS